MELGTKTLLESTKSRCLPSPHSGTSNSFVGKSNHHCHASAFPIKPAQSPSWSGPCRRSLLSPKKTPRRFISTAEEVRRCSVGWGDSSFGRHEAPEVALTDSPVLDLLLLPGGCCLQLCPCSAFSCGWAEQGWWLNSSVPLDVFMCFVWIAVSVLELCC